ncbi:MAG TPA: isoprenylcysteine carboxylmethyltransferase family protein [Candidatus Eisenbacteria bacterium]|nr:isoprenylcysteine carboxylmethyltransferase family protein [Candidatus Eisenbacteria bacterium]
MGNAARTAVFAILVHGFFLAAVPAALLVSGVAFFEFPGRHPFAAAALFAAGAALYASTLVDFVRTGEGTPAAWDPPRRFVRRGGYRYVRNPMYVGMFLVLAAEAAGLGSSAIAAYLAVLWGSFHLFVVFHEEPTLQRKFGADYETYRRSVPRWLPRPPRTEEA